MAVYLLKQVNTGQIERHESDLYLRKFPNHYELVEVIEEKKQEKKAERSTSDGEKEKPKRRKKKDES
jgi:hypothetical protein